MGEAASAVRRTACQVLVIGSGVAGYCAAIQAGREGCDTILLEKDEVLGGNSGPNLGVGITGADRYHAYATETGIIQELQEQAAWLGAFTRVASGTMPYSISRRNEAVVQAALQQAGVRVCKRHYARSPIVDGPRIAAVLVEDLAACRTVTIQVDGVVVEASGDGHIAALAGADHDQGSEGRDEYGERSAPARRRSWVQGSSLVAIAHRTPGPVDFVPPPGTPPFQPRLWHGRIGSFLQHGHGPFGATDGPIFLYMTEAGGDLDTIADDGVIYERLLAQLWSEWDHIKNGPHRDQARQWDLLWVSPKAGKRESRRFLGDVVLTQTDLESGRLFADDIAYGGHDLDDHQALGPAGTGIFGHSIPPLYGIPFRACYARNLDNLLLAGRLISATHLAHSSHRVMRTGGAVGQAVGLAAALCCRHGITPRQLYATRLSELQQGLLRRDGTILNRSLEGDSDLALQARITATSEARFDDQRLEQLFPLVAAAGCMLWDWPGRLERVEVYIRNSDGRPQPVRLRVLRAGERQRWTTAETYHGQGWSSLDDAVFTELAVYEQQVPGGFEGWLPIHCQPALQVRPHDPRCDADRLLLAVDAAPALWWALVWPECELCGLVEHSHHAPCWRPLAGRPALRLYPRVPLGEAVHVVDGHHRRYSRGPTHMWASAPQEAPPHALELQWDAPVRFRQVALTFDNLAADRADNPWECGQRVLPGLVRRYELQAWQGDGWSPLVQVDDNVHRFRVHQLPEVVSSAVRLLVHATHGAAGQARVYQVSVR